MWVEKPIYLESLFDPSGTYTQWTITQPLKKKTGSFVEMWMDLESVIQSDVSQEKIYCMLTHTCGI